MSKPIKAPFTYFGGKSRIADKVWMALGQPDHYLEPFFGSGAVLLAREFFKSGVHTETVNDKDGFICNVWRALQAAPDEVAKWCDWPVNHADLAARKAELLKNEPRLLENLIKDPAWFDPVLAGYWIWAASCSIGPCLTSPGGVPLIGTKGSGINSGCAVPEIATKGRGINSGQIPEAQEPDKGVQESYNTNIYSWFRQLSERLRYVRVVCGDWHRICGGNWQDALGVAGIFFDPPYGALDCDTTVYNHNSTNVAYHVRKWCIEHGDKKTFRIVLAGYEGEGHEQLEKYGWRAHEWTGTKGYAKAGVNENRRRERLYLSPYTFRIF